MRSGRRQVEQGKLEKDDLVAPAVPEWIPDLLETQHKTACYGWHGHIVWTRMLRRLPLPAPANAIGCALAEHWPNIHPSQVRIAELSGHRSVTTVKTHLALLDAIGVIDRHPRPGMSDVIDLTWPERQPRQADVEFWLGHLG